ncbi:interleukin-18-binding protein isoform X2 [Natator depressus]
MINTSSPSGSEQTAQPGRIDPAPACRRPGVMGAVPWLPLVLLCGHFQSSDAASSLRPEIITPLKPVKSPALGKRFSLRCQAKSPFPGMTLIYWLANGSFVEDQYLDLSVCEGDVVTEARGTGVLLTRELHFCSFSQRDRSTSFMCMVRNPAGLEKALVHWDPEQPAQVMEPQQETRQDVQTPETTPSVD